MKHVLRFISPHVIIALLWCLPSETVTALDKIDDAVVTQARTNGPSNRIDLEFGYFTCRRQTFREIYGSYFDYGLNFQHGINNRLSWSLLTEFIRLHEKGAAVKYWSLSETPMLIYTLSDRKTLVPLVGGGIGVTLRNVVASLIRYGQNTEDLGGTTVTQRELSAALLAVAGVDLHLSQAVVLGGRFYFDYHPLGDPSVGEFGDTGGYHFTFRLGRKF